MKKIIHLLAFLLISGTIFCQQQLHDGIYLVDQFTSSKNIAHLPNRVAIQFNAGFVNEDPENYKPIIIETDNYFPLEMAGHPFVQTQNNQNVLMLQLTKQAKESLATFTSNNLMREIAVVVNDQVLTIYKITNPVTGGLLKIIKCDGQACKQILKNIKGPGKS